MMGAWQEPTTNTCQQHQPPRKSLPRHRLVCTAHRLIPLYGLSIVGALETLDNTTSQMARSVYECFKSNQQPLGLSILECLIRRGAPCHSGQVAQASSMPPRQLQHDGPFVRVPDDISCRGIVSKKSAFPELVEALETQANLQPSLQPEKGQVSTRMASQVPFSASASRKRCAENELYFHSYQKERSEEVAQQLFTEQAQYVEIPKHLMQSTDTEVRNHTREAAEPSCNTTRLLSGQREVVGVPLKPTITPARNYASCDLQRNATHSTEALESFNRTQESSQQNVSESPHHLRGPINNSFGGVDVGNGATPKTTEVTKSMSAESSHGVAHHSMQRSSSNQSYGAGAAKPAILYDPEITSVNNEPNPMEACVKSSLNGPDTMGYIQQVDESGNSSLYPVSYADHPEALPFNRFLDPEMIRQIVLPHDPSQYLGALYDSVKRFSKQYVGCVADSDIGSKQKHGDANSDPVDYFRVIRARSIRQLAGYQWSELIKGVDGWLKERSQGINDEFGHFALDYFKAMNSWRYYHYEPVSLRAIVAAWCEKHQGLSEALRLVATQNHRFLRGWFITTLPDIYLKTCPYFLMYAVHHPGPEWLGSRNESGVSKSFRVQLLHELTTAAYLWQMVLHVRKGADSPEWPSYPPVTQKKMPADDNAFDTGKTKSKPRWTALKIDLASKAIFENPVGLSRCNFRVSHRIQTIESSSVTTPPIDASVLYQAIGSFKNEATAPLNRGYSLRDLSFETLLLAKDELLESFWRLRTLFHAKTCRLLRYQLDKLITETESKMESGALHEDRFLRFACGYLRAMRKWDQLSNGRRAAKAAPELTKRVFRHLADTYRVTEAVKKVAEMETKTTGLRSLPEIYKTHPASSLLPYVTWFDTSKPKPSDKFSRLKVSRGCYW
eukprot:Blabericola_migrator_1__2320@NODE_1648_length_4099_cov_24_577381_g1072_i0_p1_GENE_NODE_1648_length_4099_cov_24_577381_g1072_i0NODE_1648_length_4099_cov_24_577381_g1072_i0_p1_ORF_typecomplete_len898_score81_21_NODE_1648_length_4099_cov_24_577381_g1072_i01972890